MAYLIQPDYVKYVCPCGQIKPITNLYFCRHCLKIRCGFCICHEIDSHYCSNCLENMPSSEARLKKNRCSSCNDCPSCFHTLSTRATLAQPRQQQDAASGDAKVENKQPKKMYYLACFNCRWTSRDVGIPDQPVASGGWPERVNPFTTRVNQLLEYYKAIAQQEKQEKKYTIRGKYITLTDKTGLTGAMARNLAGMPPTDGGASSAIANFVPSQASEEVEGLPDDVYTKEVDLKQITSVAQRIGAPEWQAAAAVRLLPAPRALVAKRSQRCRACDHNLTKPEYNPGSVKFKIELLAFYHVPEIKIISHETMKRGAKSSILLKLSNPTAYEMQLRLLQPEDVPPLTEDGESEKDWPRASRGPVQGSVRLTLDPDLVLTLPQRDDAAEYDDDAAAQQQTHDIIVWRKSNKMAIRLSATVDDSQTADTTATAVLALQYSYRNTVPPSAAQPRQPQDHTLYTTLLIDLGKISQ